MSTFAVFGMNEHFAREEAKRKVRDFKIEKGQRIELSMSQWLQTVEDRVVKIMDGKRVAQLSSMFDAPPVRRGLRRAYTKAGAVPRRHYQGEDQVAAGRPETEVADQAFLAGLLT
ncbi:hypothetical protein JFU47_27655 [Pseudomonas sp. TH39(2020)]|uniref:hypothetical protein n=1 Tax=Pseudomonas sp. TH39(2020) TaxID=2796349 RepID=UPI0019132D48|nr:hypothetical protein [Pseudomonas sp. TH39(2020)]MBK5400449.1 hypothetical protein [Pseudomonas sp. TH39(2020)]